MTHASFCWKNGFQDFSKLIERFHFLKDHCEERSGDGVVDPHFDNIIKFVSFGVVSRGGGRAINVYEVTKIIAVCLKEPASSNIV